MKSPYQQYKEGSYKLPDSFELAMFQAYDVASSNNREKLAHLFPHFFSPEKDSITATGIVIAPGDHSTGIPTQCFTFELHRDLLADPDSREWHRKEFTKTYLDVVDIDCFVTFDDEEEAPGILNKTAIALAKAKAEI